MACVIVGLHQSDKAKVRKKNEPASLFILFFLKSFKIFKILAMSKVDYYKLNKNGDPCRFKAKLYLNAPDLERGKDQMRTLYPNFIDHLGEQKVVSYFETLFKRLFADPEHCKSKYGHALKTALIIDTHKTQQQRDHVRKYTRYSFEPETPIEPPKFTPTPAPQALAKELAKSMKAARQQPKKEATQQSEASPSPKEKYESIVASLPKELRENSAFIETIKKNVGYDTY
jgi:hypothetical protein